MASTYLAPTCKPWLRFHRDTWRVNESPREAREHFASRLKAWVRFRPRMFFFVFFVFKKLRGRTHLDLLSIPRLWRKKYLGTTKASTRMILVHVQKMYKIFRLLIEVPDYSSSFFPFFFKK